jgi:hypothetical protein
VVYWFARVHYANDAVIQNGKAGMHHYIGSSLFIAVCVQVLLGYYHHVLFVKLRHRTSISYAHIVLGWFVVFVGWLNTFL